MRTVHPSIMIGSYVLDQDRVPRDEFLIRQNALNAVMDAQGLKAMLIYGDAAEHSALAWFSNFAPRLRWGMALMPREGEPRLLISMSSRDVPAMKLMTWIPDVLSGWTWDSAFNPWLTRLQAEHPIALGTVGFDLMRQPLFRSLEKSLGNRFRLQAADAEVAALRTLRPREHTQIRDAVNLMQSAATAFAQVWRGGADIEAAALAGERTARMKAAQDVRTLVSFDGGRTLSPYRGAFTARPASLVGYIAVKHRGYWAETFVTDGDGTSTIQQRTRAALDSLLQMAGPGVGAAAMHAKALEQIGVSLHPVLSGIVGRRIGLSLNEGGDLAAGSGHVLKQGEVYALHLGAQYPAGGGALASAMVMITAGGAEILCRSSEISARVLGPQPPAPKVSPS
jgi:Xaa-Pro aminopeptidase